MKKIIISIFIFLLSISPFALAGNSSPNGELLEEIDITEAILNVLLSTDRGVTSFSGLNIGGYYLADYGVIFHVNYHQGFKFIYEVFNSQTKPQETKQFVLNNKDKAEQKNLIPELKNKIARFFNNYGPTLTGLKLSEKITIILDLNGNAFMQPGSKNSLPSQLIATVSMGDILKYKEKKPSAIENQIIFTEVNSINDETEIFSDVIKSSFKHVNGSSGLDLNGEVKSIYLQGHGIVFMADVGVGMGLQPIIMKIEDAHRKLNASNQIALAKKLPDESEPNKDISKEYEDRLIKLISKYGYTLSKINKDEWVIVMLNFNRMGITSNFSKDVIKVKKSDIDDFNRGKIDFVNFRKKVSVVQY